MFPWVPLLVLCPLLAGLSPAPAAAEAAAPTLAVTAGAVTVLETAGDIRTVVVAVPEIADATVTAPRKLFLLGRKTGRTGLLVIGTDGAPLLEATVTVAPADAGVVTVARGTHETTLSCTPRCSEAEAGKAGQTNPAAPSPPAAPAGSGGLAPPTVPTVQIGR